MAAWVGIQGQVTSVKKEQKHALIMTSPTGNPISKTLTIFLI